jgi:ATP-dependent Lon protease
MNKNISNVLKNFFVYSYFKIKEKKNIINKFEILKKYFNKIIYNLTELNQLNYFKESNNHYNNILKNIEVLKQTIDSYSDINFKTKSYILLKIKKELLNHSNFVSSKKIKTNLSFIDKDYNNYFNKNELDIIDFINEFVTITCFWMSDFHKEETDEEYKNNKNKLILVPNNNTFNNSNNFFKSVFINSILDPSNNQNNNQETYVNNDTDETSISNLFSKMDIIKELNENKILIQKNKKANSLVENKFGTSIYIKLNESIIVFQGIFIDDLFNLSLKYKFVKNIFADQENHLMRDLSNINNTFKYSYYNVINLRDKMILSPKDIMNEIKKKYNDFKTIQGKPIMLLINEFILGSKYRKIDILTLFLMSNDEDQKLAFILFDIFKLKDKKNIATEIYNSLHHSIRKKLDLAKLNADAEEKDILEITEDDLSYEKKIQLMGAEKQIKIKAIEKLKLIKNSLQGDSKAQAWLDGLLKIPFNHYSENEIMSFKKKFISKLPVKLYSDIEIDDYFKNNKSNLFEEWITYKNDKKQYLKDVRKILDSSVYGHTEAKLQLERIFAQWINGEEKGAVLGLQGPPGTGKTSLAKLGLSKCLKDKNGNLRPFAFLAVGGAVNGSTLIGHNYTYVGSTWGKIVDILITTKCMNPIIFIDELDKVSATENGREIISILTHLTDSTQNDDFEDKFFAGVKLNLSRALIIFSFNDIKLIDPILKDRITVIETKPLSLKDKIEIINNYMLPQICTDIGFSNNEILISDDIIKFIVETYTLEAGVRKLKEKIIELVREINLQRFYDDNIVFPFNITKEFCEKIFELKPKIKIKKIIDVPTIGVVNGLYANSAGLGGITTIQAIKFPSDKLFDLNLTGSLGDVMKESINYALKLAISLLPSKIKDELIEKKFGIHLHCPEGGVKKDGPSAGAAITLALYSLLANIPVNNKVALTGEIDLLGNVTAIGGLNYKLDGAKKAGVELVLYPEENQDDIDILRKENTDLEDQTFHILPVSRIEQIFEKALLNNI